MKDFEHINMPFVEADGYVKELVTRTTERAIVGRKPKTQTKRLQIWTVAAAVAVLVVGMVLIAKRDKPQDIDTFLHVELAYNNLSTEDQEFLMEVYEEDVFLIENEEMDY